MAVFPPPFDFRVRRERTVTSLSTHKETVHSDWIDYNGHMNVAYYVLVFDHATDAVLEKLELGEEYRQKQDKSFFVVESHVSYVQEVKKNESLVVKSSLVGYDDKRLHLYHEMFTGDGKHLCATNEVLALHVDMKLRKACRLVEDLHPALQLALDKCLMEGFPKRCCRAIAQVSLKK